MTRALLSVPVRRLLLLPAIAGVVLGAPVLATAQSAPPPATTETTPVTPGQTVGAGWSSAPIPVDGDLVGVKWTGDRSADFDVQVEHDDGTWTKATSLGSDADGQADPATKDGAREAQDPSIASEPLWVGEHATAVKVTLTDGQAANVAVAAVDAQPAAAAPGGSASALSDILPPVDGPDRYVFAIALFALAALLVAVGLGWSPWRSRRVRRLVPIIVLGALVAACAPASPPGNGSQQPGIYSRTDWGARPFACAGGPEYAPKLEFAVVHHTVNSNNYSPASVASMIRGIQAYHMDANGYCDIAYNFIVDKYGGIWEARAGGIAKPVIGGHTGGFNSGSVGVALLGDYTSVAPTTAQWNALVSLLRWRMSVGGVNPKAPFTHTVASSPCNCQRWAPGTVVTLPVSLVGHRDLDYTACPGDKLWPMLYALRDQVSAGYVPPTTTTSTSTTTTTLSHAEAPSTTTTTVAPTSTTTTSTSTP